MTDPTPAGAAHRLIGLDRSAGALMASAPRPESNLWSFTLIRLVDFDPFGAATLQRAPRHRFSTVLPNSR
jgi:hypothetical protein